MMLLLVRKCSKRGVELLSTKLFPQYILPRIALHYFAPCIPLASYRSTEHYLSNLVYSIRNHLYRACFLTTTGSGASQKLLGIQKAILSTLMTLQCSYDFLTWKKKHDFKTLLYNLKFQNCMCPPPKKNPGCSLGTLSER